MNRDHLREDNNIDFHSCVCDHRRSSSEPKKLTSIKGLFVEESVAYGHTTLNTPDLV